MTTGGVAAPAAPGLPDRCPRCGGHFRCDMNDATPCACSTLALEPALLAALGRRWQGCLCLACLQALAGGAPLEPAAQTRGA